MTNIRNQNTSAIRPVLSQIRLHNFKSVADAVVDLKPLTVVVGKNSSGKSTLLQSVLVLAQAVKNNSNSRQFPLNGEFVRLGTFSEVKNFSDLNENGEIGIGFTVTPPRLPGMANEFVRRAATTVSEGKPSVSWEGHLSKPSDSSNGFTSITAVQMRVLREVDGLQKELISVDISEVLNDSDRSNEIGFNPFDPQSTRFAETVLKVDGRLFNFDTGEPTPIKMATLAGGIPRLLFKEGTRFETYARIWWDEYTEALKQEFEIAKRSVAEAMDTQESIAHKAFAVNTAFKDISMVANEDGTATADLQRSDRAFWSRFGTDRFFATRAVQLSDRDKKKVAESMAILLETRFRTELKKKLKNKYFDQVVHSEVGGRDGEQLLMFGRSVDQFFSTGVKYLGPLRQAPQDLYSPGPDKDDLGKYGEYAAGVLHSRSQSSKKDDYPMPDGHVSRVTLLEALNSWLQHLDLVEQATATDRGRWGIGLEVTPRGSSRSLNLTSVGVGVSQVLPVVLLCLITRPGKLVVIEQPELHLHPAMQLKLADFLLACVKTGRQILVETHSEHLVNRLRLRSAENPETNAQLIRLLFAEQQESNTVYRSSDVNDEGGLEESWPEGFLDVGANEAAEFLRMNIQKWRALNSSK
jgi:predicted ATPase